MKRKKANIYDLINNNIDYFAFQRVKNSKGEPGYRYILDKELNEKQKNVLQQFKNVIISSCQYKYAPEIKHTTIILLDKCIKEE